MVQLEKKREKRPPSSSGSEDIRKNGMPLGDGDRTGPGRPTDTDGEGDMRKFFRRFFAPSFGPLDYLLHRREGGLKMDFRRIREKMIELVGKAEPPGRGIG